MTRCFRVKDATEVPRPQISLLCRKPSDMYRMTIFRNTQQDSMLQGDKETEVEVPRPQIPFV